MHASQAVMCFTYQISEKTIHHLSKSSSQRTIYIFCLFKLLTELI